MRWISFLVVAASLPAAASAAESDADAGRRLVEEKHCETCHHNKTLGDAKAIYLRKDRKVTSMEKLKAQVALCNSELNLQLFPEEEEQVVGYLDKTYYRFSASPAAPSPSPGTARTH